MHILTVVWLNVGAFVASIASTVVAMVTSMWALFPVLVGKSGSCDCENNECLSHF